MKKTIVQFQAQVDNIVKKKDRTLSVRLGTQEMNAEDSAHVFGMDGMVWVAVSPTELDESDLEIPEFLPEFKGHKSFSQRQREVLYRLWEQVDNGKHKTSDQFYRDYMEKSISNIKDKLN
jgi:hypothetical protein